jgi:hypothetical protein
LRNNRSRLQRKETLKFKKRIRKNAWQQFVKLKPLKNISHLHSENIIIMDSTIAKPLVLSEDISLVDYDLKQVYRHLVAKNSDDNPASNADVRFKKKESVDTLAKSILKHRIQGLTGKSLPNIESELGKNIEDIGQLRKLAKLLLLEAFGKLTPLPAVPVSPAVPKRKRGFQPDEDDIFEARVEETPTRKRGRMSMAVLPSRNVEMMDTSNASPSTLRKRSRKSMAPDTVDCRLSAVAVQDEVDLGDLGPNPTPQMVAMRRKSMAAAAKKGGVAKRTSTIGKGSPFKNVNTEVKTLAVAMKKKKIESAPPMVSFPGDKDCAIYLVEADIIKMKGVMEFAKVQNLVGPRFQGANLSVLHTPVQWNAADVFALTMNLKMFNRKANLDTYLMLVGCGVSNINITRDALFRHTKHVQVVVFEKEDMNANAQSEFLRETTALFLLAYFFPGCEDEDALPKFRMVRPNLTTCFHTKSTEDLENAIMHAFSEEGDWVFDLCCGGRELCLAGLCSKKVGYLRNVC